MKIKLEAIEAAMADETGFCIECGEESEDMIEPDARGYPCYECGEAAVYGAEEIIMMGLMDDDD